ncbi:UDP-N-acetylmuramoylalanyl-D-glutamyl-2,6-diaminopimelate--D-alanyl-D-alanine ligase [Stappia sp.]|uniref:UDP-N-acetylmuramoylalanyl-D-glutamyl-2, 6-diaminopimelate--D-alanyl-D-alanine ligase n=1 Tax=Stappia sp. TaxID=1870903 RepID=UPI0032D903D2
MLLGEAEARDAPDATPVAHERDADDVMNLDAGGEDVERLETVPAEEWPDAQAADAAPEPSAATDEEAGEGTGLDLDLDLEALLEAPLETGEVESEPSEGGQEGVGQDDAAHADASDLPSPESVAGEDDAAPDASETWAALDDALLVDTGDAGSERTDSEDTDSEDTDSEDTHGEGAGFDDAGAEAERSEEAGVHDEGGDDAAPQAVAPEDIAPEDIAPQESVPADAEHPSQDTDGAAAALLAGAAVASALSTPARAPVGGAVPGATPLPEWEEPDPDRPLWTIAEMVEATGGTMEGIDDPATAVVGLSIDSRTLAAGEAFIAIVGDRFDGHAFTGAALDAGAALAVVARDKRADLPADGRYLLVADPLEALRDLARAARARSRARIVAVTGSVGKTGTKEMLRLALDASGRTHAAVASFNNHWGVPLTLARLPVQARFGVFEIGMNHAGEITPLVQMVRPHVAIITTVEAVHLENFGSVERIAQAKAEIFLGLEPGGLALLNRDNRQFDLLTYLAKTAGVRRIATFGREGPADVEAERISAQVGCTSISGHVFDREITYKVGAPGRHLVTNSLAVLAAVVELGGDLARGALALGEFHAPKGRGAQVTLRLPDGEATVIDESYNANPASMRAALSLLKETPVARPGRRIAVLGDMLELGESELRLHGELLGPLRQSDVDLVYCAGRRMRALWDDLPKHLRGAYAEEAESLRPLLLDDIRPGDVMMIKGSLGSRMGPLVEALRDEFPVGDDGSR